MEGSLRQKRRPALSCEQCRRRKVKCDRYTPCRQCTKANINSCQYFHDARTSLTMAPFEAQDTRFMVFDQALAPQNYLTNAIEKSPENSSTSNSWSPRSTNELYELSIPTQQSDLQFGTFLSCKDTCSQPMGTSYEILPKKRFYGKSHWRNYLPQSPELSYVLQSHEAANGFTTFSDCAKISVSLEEQENMSAAPSDNLVDLLPPRELVDLLVQAYLRTFQTVFGILDVPAFRRDYIYFWSNSKQAHSRHFLATLILVTCIGSAFYSDERGISRATVLKSVSVVDKANCLKDSNDTCTLDGLRIQCLLFLARQARSIKTHWSADGYLLRMATYMGLHIDPEKESLPRQSDVEREHRRKLWATVLELEIQYCMDHGSLLIIDPDAYDTSLPSNIDDQSSQVSVVSATPKPLDHLTHSSFQILLMKTIPVRLKIVHFINKINSTNLYQDATSLFSEFSEVTKSCNDLIEAYRMSSSPPTAFQTKLFDLFTKRFTLALHHPFSVNSCENPLHVYSQQLCTKTAISLLSPSTYSKDDDFHHLCLRSGGPFQVVYRQCALFLCGEMLQHSLHPMQLLNLVISDENRQAVIRYIQLAKSRIESGEKNIKCYVLVSCLLAQADARRASVDAEPILSRILQSSLESCRLLLSQQLAGDAGSAANLMTCLKGRSDWPQWDGLIDYETFSKGPELFSTLGSECLQYTQLEEHDAVGT